MRHRRSSLAQAAVAGETAVPYSLRLRYLILSGFWTACLPSQSHVFLLTFLTPGRQIHYEL